MFLFFCYILLFFVRWSFMLQFFIRYATTIYCTNYIYHKISNQTNIKFFSHIIYAFITLITTTTFYLLPSKCSFIVFPLQILMIFIYHFSTEQKSSKTIFCTLILAYGICYICYFFAILFVIIPLTPIATYLVDITFLPTTFLQFLIVCLHCLLCYFLFQIKRFRNGIPFLHNPFVSKIGVFLGILIICCNMLFSTIDSKKGNKQEFIYILIIFFLLIFITLFFIWWQNEIHHSYLLQVKEQECRRLEEQLSYCQEKISVLEKDNTELSKLIHRDNKLIPSMQLAVHSFLNQIADSTTTDLPEEGKSLILQLETEMSERSTYIDILTKSQKQLPATGTSSIDQLLAYFLQRCSNLGITFDCSFFGSFSSILKETLSEKELSTLLADLLENAFIATKHNAGKNILLHMGILDDCFFLEVWDNGEPFPKEVLYHFGRKKYTTHKQDGGSGIGMMVTYEMLQKYHGSFLIDETVSDKSFCTKKVIVIFDGKSRYHLYSKRSPEELTYLSKRKDLEIFSKIPNK